MTKKRKKKKSRIYIIWLMNLCLTIAVIAFFVWHESVPDVSPENALKTYNAHILNWEYDHSFVRTIILTTLLFPFLCNREKAYLRPCDSGCIKGTIFLLLKI